MTNVQNRNCIRRLDDVAATRWVVALDWRRPKAASSTAFMRLTEWTGLCLVLASSVLLGACDQVRGLAPSTDESARYELQRDDQDRMLRLDKVTGEVVVIEVDGPNATPPRQATRPRAEITRPVSVSPTARRRGVAESAPVTTALPPAPPLATGTRITIIRPSPVFMTTNEKQTPLEVLASGAVARVLKTEGDWYLIEFEGARWGRRVGYLKSTAIDLGQQPMDLSVPDSQQLEPMDLSVPSVK